MVSMAVFGLFGFFNFRKPSKFIKAADNEKNAEKSRDPPPKMDPTESLRSAKKELAQMRIRMATYAEELDK